MKEADTWLTLMKKKKKTLHHLFVIRSHESVGQFELAANQRQTRGKKITPAPRNWPIFSSSSGSMCLAITTIP